MLNLYSIFVYYVLFYQKKLPTSQKTPYHFPAEVGSTPYTPPVCVRAWSTELGVQTMVIEHRLHLKLIRIGCTDHD